MRSLIRWSAIGIIGSAILGSTFGGNMPAQALPQEQVVETLRYVPVFAVVGEGGAPLVANAEGRNVSGVFISQEDAIAFVTKLKQENPDLGAQVQIQPASLAEIHKLDQQQAGGQDELDFAYVPMEEQVQQAETILREQGEQVQQFNGVPLFVARGGTEQGYLTLQQDGEQVIPFFFEREQLQQLIDRFQQQQPDQASSIQVEVIPLENIIATLEQRDDAQLSNIMLVPSRESLQFLQSVQQQAQ
jgi:hypothetical protein